MHNSAILLFLILPLGVLILGLGFMNLIRIRNIKEQEEVRRERKRMFSKPFDSGNDYDSDFTGARSNKDAT